MTMNSNMTGQEDERMNYSEALAYINGIQNQLGSDYSLRDVAELAARAGHPEKSVPMVHLAGTNGKGSVGNAISSILAASGYRVGRYVSPAVFDYRERVQLVEQSPEGMLFAEYMTEEEMADCIMRLREFCLEMTADGFGQPTAFEMETVMAFLLFAAWKVDIAVVECGLGGRLDATNILPSPLLCVFSSISRDHMAVLGNSIPEIAGEKYGIIKPGTQVVSKRQAECEEILQEICNEKKAGLTFMEEERLQEKGFSLHNTVFDYKDKEYSLGQKGAFQVENAAIALEAVWKLAESGFSQITEESIRDGFLKGYWRGRFDLVSEEPFLLVDGAHNAEAAKALRRSLELYFPEETFSFVIGMFQDKEYEAVLRELLPFAKCVYAVTAPGERGLPAEELCHCIRGICEQFPVYVCDGVKAAVERAVAENQRGKTVVCGSLSVLSEIYKIRL